MLGQESGEKGDSIADGSGADGGAAVINIGIILTSSHFIRQKKRLPGLLYIQNVAVFHQRDTFLNQAADK